jgi:DNA-binding transcriptional MocR family regulator
VALALLRRLSPDGQCDPSHETIAQDVGCSARTVRRALAQLKSLGLLTWQRRLVPVGRGTEQTSNAYALIVPGMAQTTVSAMPPPGGQNGRPILKRYIKRSAPVPQPSYQQPEVSPEAQREAQEALARRRAAVMAQQRAVNRAALPLLPLNGPGWASTAPDSQAIPRRSQALCHTPLHGIRSALVGGRH